MLHLSVYDFWSLNKKELQTLLQRRRSLRQRVSTAACPAARVATAAAAASAAAPDVCLAEWRPGDSAESARSAVETLLEEASREGRAERVDKGDGGAGECWSIVECVLPEREALTQR